MNMQSQKWVNLALLGIGTLLFLFFSKAFQMVWDLARWPLFSEWPVEPIYLLGFAVAGGTAVALRMNQKANVFFNEVVLELVKVTWPQRKETVASSGVVVLLVGVAAVIMFLIDFLWGTVSRGLLKF